MNHGKGVVVVVVVVECAKRRVQGAPCVLLVLQVRVPGSYQAGRRYQPCKVHVIKLSSFVQVYPGTTGRAGQPQPTCVHLVHQCPVSTLARGPWYR